MNTLRLVQFVVFALISLLPLVSVVLPLSPVASTNGGGRPTPTPSSPIPPLVITTTSLPDGNIGTPYSNFLTSSGGRGTPDKWSLVVGRLPDGLTMANFYGIQSSVISGAPHRLQTTIFTVKVEDGTGHTTTQTLSITINGPRPLVITNQRSTLASGIVGSSYFANLSADGGVPPYSWAIVPGQLPPGLTLSPGLISGTPTTTGTFIFTVRVTDSGGQQVTPSFTIAVN